jgi:hypothetical protein
MAIDPSRRIDATTDTPQGLVARATSQVRQFVCGLHGHDALLHFEQGRISLQCTSCGYESPGWDVRSIPSSRTDPMAAPRRVIRLPLVGQRRVA